VISVLPISLTLLQDGYNVHYKQKQVKKEEEPIKHCGSPRNKHAQSSNLPSDGISVAISHSNSDMISVTIPDSNLDTISECPKAIFKCNSDHPHCSTVHQEGGLRQWLSEAVSEHLSRQ